MYQDECDIMIQATGALNNWKWPKITGLHDFKGKLMHSASWDENYDYAVCRNHPCYVAASLTFLDRISVSL